MLDEAARRTVFAADDLVAANLLAVRLTNSVAFAGG